MSDVWDITTGSSSIKVGVIDSGISNIHTDLNDNIGINSGDGTSFAAPYISGVAALILSRYPNLPINNLKSCILESATFIEDFGTDELNNYIITGSFINPLAAINYHSHDYSYDYYDSSKHSCIFYCGYSTLENHDWIQTNKIIFNDEINAVPGAFTCWKCGAAKITNTLTEDIMIIPHMKEDELI